MYWMFSCFRQLAERTVSSSSSTGAAGSDRSGLSPTARGLWSRPCRSTNTASCSEDVAGPADGLLRLDGAVGLDVDDQLVEVGALLDAGALDVVGHTAHGAEGGVHLQPADGTGLFLELQALVGRLVAAAALHLELHVQRAGAVQVRDHQVLVHDLDVVVQLDVGGLDHARALLGQGEVASSRVCMRMASSFRLSRMSTTSSWTPSMVVYSCSTPSISASTRRRRAWRTAGCGAARCRACGRSPAPTVPAPRAPGALTGLARRLGVASRIPQLNPA